MTEIESKWLSFAQKYLALDKASQLLLVQKLNPQQKNYLESLVFEMQKKITQAPETHLNTLASTQNQSNSSNPTQPNSKSLNLQMIMPKRNLDFGLRKEKIQSQSQVTAVNDTVGHNLSKTEYLLNKKKAETKNSLIQAVLVVLALALPLGSVAFVMTNSRNIDKISAGSKTSLFVSAQNNSTPPSFSKEDFDAWIAKYNDIKDDQKTPDSDPDKDGLTNAEEMALSTIPTNPRTCNSARLDSENILADIDPQTCKPINFNDPGVAQKFDGVVSRTILNQRLSVVALQRFYENFPIMTEADRATSLDIDYSKNATLQLLTSNPDLQKVSPLSIGWAQPTGSDNFTKNMLTKNLESKLVFYPDLGVVGKSGVSYISGKNPAVDLTDSSSDLFLKLDQLTPEDAFKLTVETKDGQSHNYFYKIKNQNLVLSSDPKQFGTAGKQSELVLATPWPSNSPEHRLVIKAVLDRIE